MKENKELLQSALSVGHRMADEYIFYGDYRPRQSWGCEGQIYPSLTGLALLQLYRVIPDNKFIDGVKAIIQSNVKKQLQSGGWPLLLGATGNGMRFEVSEHMVKLTATMEDLPPTATALRLMAEYKLLTGDTIFDESLLRGFRFLLNYWNDDEGVFDEMLVGEALKLRASPQDYLIYTYQCVHTLSQLFEEAKKFVIPLYTSLKRIFEEMDADTYPLLYGMHAGLISFTEGDSEYVNNTVKNRIINHIALKSRFLIPEHPGAFGHRDGLRGICLNEGHLRNSVGVAIAMKYYDVFTRNSEFTETKLYNDICKWIQAMFDLNRYYEFIDIETGQRLGEGSSGQYLPIYWISGKF